ncbi:MAG TPA: phenylacetate--CoA ligase family protein [Thermodesulforhabdus norvegica]|uniref:Phenylacetate-coenzyme A ligase n=1 Tax=Thermodesulforhabdus norvegica TaxID=39841 RepID=A0A7C1AXF1_9BACT|nr:phenylacetate--CoA ligase [Deltaproteobacteria bacterium]MBW2067689.1 phenylacetate--CoA ligase [Deltaproteobacteria bacterium]HDL89428.1 phenylacetate--CoA ligase family protein [Thermodesulforhabdus norvegica]
MNTECWNPERELITRDKLEALQEKLFLETVQRASRSPFYRKKFEETGISIKDIKSLSDITKLPFTTKQDLRDWYPYGFLTVEKEKLVRLHVSSGTTGQATAVFYTRKDIESWAELMARCMYMTGARPGDVFQNMTGYGLFTGGLGFHYGAEKIGLLTIPSGAGNSKRQIQLMRDFGTNVIHIIPSYALRLMDVLNEMGINPRESLDLRIGYLGAEPYSEEVRQRVQEFYGIKAFNSYGLSEMNGPGVAFECTYQQGMHLWEDAYIMEIVDQHTLEPVPEGTLGELVLTTLSREGMPLIRYRTKDLTRIIPGQCPCGRPHRRIDRIQGRSDDMFIIKGVNIFPVQVEQVLMSIPEVGTNYRIILKKEREIDQMIVQVEVTDKVFVEDMRHLQRLQKKIASELRSELLVTPIVELVEPNALPRSNGKVQRLIDMRCN